MSTFSGLCATVRWCSAALCSRSYGPSATAVERGVGISLLPTYICQQALTDGRLVSLYDVTDLIPADPWFATIRRVDAANPALAAAINALRRHTDQNEP